MRGTIVPGRCKSVQGVVIAQQSDGRVGIPAGGRTFIGFPVRRRAA
jgi:hypothetical protein